MGPISVRWFYNKSECTTYHVAHHLVYRARSRFGVYPLTHSWYLDGHALEEKGLIRVGETQVQFEVGHGTCELWTKSGDSLSAELILASRDGTGRQISSSVSVRLNGRLTRGGYQEIQKQVALLTSVAQKGAALGGRPNLVPSEMLQWNARNFQAEVRRALNPRD